MLYPNNSWAPEHNVLITGFPTINDSVTAVLNPSLYEEHTYKSHFATYLYGLSLYPNKWNVSVKLFSLIYFSILSLSSPTPNVLLIIYQIPLI